MAWRHVSMLFPQLAELELMQNGQPNPHLRVLCHIGQSFQGITQDSVRFAANVFSTFSITLNTAICRSSCVQWRKQATDSE